MDQYFKIVNNSSNRPLLLICDHASNYIPPTYQKLGLTADQLKEHIAWDIGAAEITLQISEILNSVAILSGISRLIVDANRDPSDQKSAPEISDNITITERGTCFGYRDLMVDPRSFLILKRLNYPVFFDVGHSVRKNGFPSSNVKDGGQKEFGETYARAAISNFVDGLFVEVHPDPKNAKCDAATQFSFTEFENLMNNVKPLWDFVNSDRI